MVCIDALDMKKSPESLYSPSTDTQSIYKELNFSVKSFATEVSLGNYDDATSEI